MFSFFLKKYFLFSQAGLSIFVSYLRWTRIAYVPLGIGLHWIVYYYFFS